MSELEIIPDGGRRRRWSAADKLRIVEETMFDGESISAVARRNGVAPNLLYRWRKLMLEGGSIAVAADDSVTGNKTVREKDLCILVGFPDLAGDCIVLSGFEGGFMALFLREAADRIGDDIVLGMTSYWG